MQVVVEWMVYSRVVVIGFSSQLEHWKSFPKVTTIRKPLRQYRVLKSITKCVSPLFKENKLKRKRNSSRILLAEDNKVNQHIITKMLKSLNFYDFQIVSNGNQAIEGAKTGSFDLILMDIQVEIFF